MAFTKRQIILALVLITAGSLNTIAVKWMDSLRAEGRDGIERNFIHPFIQADVMFVGEFLCLITFFIIFKKLASRKDGSEDRNGLTKGSRKFNIFILLPPACMDITATSIMYIGLTLTNASSFQMLRGSVIVFVALLSIIVFKRKLSLREWIGIILIIIALATVGLSDIKTKDKVMATTTTLPIATSDVTDTPAEGGDTKFVVETVDVVDEEDEQGHKNVVVGDILIICAQVVTSCQMVYEEVFVNKLDIPPLQMVGYEGMFGLIILSLLLIPFSYIPNIHALRNINASGNLEDSIDAFAKISNNWLIGISIAGLILSIAFFNYSGISVTKEINATTRMVLDSVRILVIWVFALMIGWQHFHYLQVVGFILLIIGMCIYNNIIVDKLKIFKN